MAILTIESTNPKLSWILSKNPETMKVAGKPFERTLRKGKLYGWFGGVETFPKFTLFFKDGDNEMSFSSRDFEYMDTTRYVSPQIPLAMMTEALATAYKTEQQEDVPASTRVRTTISVYPNLMERITRATGVKATQIGQSHVFRIEAVDTTVNGALNLLSIVCALACLHDEEIYLPMNEESVEKYIRVLKSSGADYHMWHMFLLRAVTSVQMFDKIKPLLNLEGVTFQYGNSQLQRYTAVREALGSGTGRTLYDVGCGELYYVQRMWIEYAGIMAYDCDEDVVAYGHKKLKRWPGAEDKVTLMPLEVKADIVEGMALNDDCDVLLTEVLEHMEKDDARKMLHAFVASDAGKIVVTVPNNDFNKHYGIPENEFRHDDHKWEPSFADMVVLSNVLADTHHRKVTQGGIGDCVHGIYPSTLITFGPKE